MKNDKSSTFISSSHASLLYFTLSQFFSSFSPLTVNHSSSPSSIHFNSSLTPQLLCYCRRPHSATLSPITTLPYPRPSCSSSSNEMSVDDDSFNFLVPIFLKFMCLFLYLFGLLKWIFGKWKNMRNGFG